VTRKLGVNLKFSSFSLQKSRLRIYKWRRISRRAVLAPAVLDFALRAIKHGE
jgi:hypothetical protein